MCERFGRLTDVNMGDLPTWIASGIAFVVGVVGIVFGALGYSQAKKSNRIASSARDDAARANDIAEKANRLSQEANFLAARTVALQEEGWVVDWRAHWDAGLAMLTLTNTGSDPARETAVTASGTELLFDSGPLGDLAPGDVAGIRISEIAALRSAHEAERIASQRSLQASGIAYVGSRFAIDIKVTVRWKTGLGFPKHHEIEITVN